MYCRADSWVGTAPANVGDMGIDVFVGGLSNFLEHDRRRHEHASLAIAALRHVHFHPKLLQDMVAALRQTLKGRDMGSLERLDGQHARARGSSVQVYGACAALRYSASIFCAGHPQVVAEHPQQRRGGVDSHGMMLAVDVN